MDRTLIRGGKETEFLGIVEPEDHLNIVEIKPSQLGLHSKTQFVVGLRARLWLSELTLCGGSCAKKQGATMKNGFVSMDGAVRESYNVAIIGAGFSGLGMAARLKESG